MTSPPERPGPFERWNARFPTVGELALGALVLGAVTGLALTAGYDVSAGRRSLALLELTSRAGAALRALHAWSGHLLLVLAVLHAVEHLAARTDPRLRAGPWLRVVACAPLAVALLLSGFVLRGDADGAFAREVVAGLLERLPAGASLAAALAGTGRDLQLPYVHHAATLTLAVLAVAVEHGRRLAPGARALALVLAAAAAGALVAPPGLRAGEAVAARGPWYLGAFQEVLRFLPRPGVAWLGLALPLAALAAARWLVGRARRLTLRGLAGALVLYAAATAWVELRPRPAGAGGLRPFALARLDEARVPLVRGEPEGCLACHDEVTGVEAVHGPEVAGCSGCHLGDPYAPAARAAHAGMVAVPGELASAEATCGRSGCHADQVARVRGSLMATVRGMIAVDRWALGEAPTPDGKATPAGLGGSPADLHLRQLCVSCHLGTPKRRPGPATELTRGGGCVACHLREPARRDYAPATARRFAHPALSVGVRDEACFGCHARSARISLSYAGWWESGLDPEEARSAAPGTVRRLEDGRLVSRAAPDVHQAKGMGCVDCHTARELMGDGEVHLHEEQATRVRCDTCHRTAPAATVATDSLAGEVRATLRARFGDAPPPRLLVEDRSREPLTGAWPGGSGAVIVKGKLSAREHVSTPPARACAALPGHARLSCQSCHSPWVTSCISCHTQWDAGAPPAVPGAGGRWVEYEAPPRLDAPALGLLRRDGVVRIEPVVPGMILTANGPGVRVPAPLPEVAAGLVGPGTRALRAWALAVPHTTTRAGRSCASCHADPFAIGAGRGVLSLEREGAGWGWRFAPEHAPGPDGLPEDAWVAFLGTAGGIATRLELAPLDPATQLRTLAVGACLPCHDPASPAGRALYARFREAAARPGPRCRVPPLPPPAP